jgi:hypothetical protein
VAVPGVVVARTPGVSASTMAGQPLCIAEY